MRRREIITMLGSAAVAWPLTGWTQEPPKIWRIGILHSGFPNRTPIHLLFAALRTLGYEEGWTAAVELLGADGVVEGNPAACRPRRSLMEFQERQPSLAGQGSGM